MHLWQEVVATGGLPGPPVDELAGATATHLSPQDFHAMLERSGDEAVLLDVRNLYETRVGRFSRVMHSLFSTDLHCYCTRQACHTC